MPTNNLKKDAALRHKLEKIRIQLEQSPENLLIREQYAILLSDNGFVNEAIKEYNFLITLSANNSDLYYNLGILYEKAKDLSTAIKYYQKTVEMDPKNSDYHYNLAYALDMHGDIDGAFKEYQITINLDPSDSNALFNIGCIYSKKEQSTEAIECFSRAISINPKDEYALFYMAFEYQKLKEFDVAIKNYLKVIKLKQDYSWAYYNLGYIYLEQKQEILAYNAFKNAFEYNNSDKKALKKFVEIAELTNNTHEVLASLEKTLENNPSNYTVSYQLAELYYKSARLKQALLYYQKALTSCGKTAQTLDTSKINARIELIKAQLKKQSV